ncbi:T9SS type A sorting domain-containing protein [Chitinophaga sedimenti]|uniref:T9SS type A sorting domain-containing protein n=1 Tax=Chitinophaga sedimenti TaxID=2033606 RepID=UPI0020042452|nr:T9SS type A sorting domain-containing protein [Chitinophaga sedimenti]MCK7558094.1 T9SS type A sorting domain-containing protein [Chitinophaga sedimenti]
MKADAVIVNFPSNDASSRYTLDEQKANFERIAATCDSMNVPLWVTTTTGRDTMWGASRVPLVQMRDWLKTRFGAKCIDFWTGIAKDDGTIIDSLGSGDGIHFNDKAHRLMANRVMKAGILDTLCKGASEAAYFTATLHNGNSVSLNWKTTRERRISYFYVQASSDGDNWQTLVDHVNIPAKGPAYAGNTYQLVTTHNAYYYRIVAMDHANRGYEVSVTGYTPPSSWQPYQVTGFKAVADFNLVKMDWSTPTIGKLKTMLIQRSLDSAQWVDVKSFTPGLPYVYKSDDDASPDKVKWYRIQSEDSSGVKRYSTALKVVPDTMYFNPWRIYSLTASINSDRAIYVALSTTIRKGLNYTQLLRSADNGLTWDTVGSKRSQQYNNGAHSSRDDFYDVVFYEKDVQYKVFAADTLGRVFYTQAVTLPGGTRHAKYNKWEAAADFGNVVLNWQTAFETKTLRFVIRRSADGFKWDIIGAKPAAGNSTDIRDYTHTDLRVQQIPLYYQIGVEDSAGRHVYAAEKLLVTPDSMYAQPYRLQSFTGTQDANQQTLEWRTSVEKKTARYVVDRSDDGTTWRTGIDTVAAGTAPTGRSYSVTYTYNISTTTKNVHYRLRLIDSLNRTPFLVGTVKIVADTNFANPYRLAGLAAERNLTSQSITWSTSKEWRMSHYLLERNVANTGWTKIDSLPAKGTSETLSNYAATDTSYSEKNISYRVQMVDKYGRSFTSPVLALAVDSNYTRFYKLAAFTAKRDGNQQTIDWSTSKEWNTVKFRIERNFGLGWEILDSVAAAGIAMQGRTYAYTDTAYKYQETYYRITVFDKFNRSERSGEAWVKMDTNYVTPVRYATYGVRRELDKQVISWNTTKEFKLAQFNILRIIGGKLTAIDSVKAAGPGEYQFTDTAYSELETYYRIQAKDVFGRAFLSDERFVRSDTNFITPVRYAELSAAREYKKQILSWTTSKEFRTKTFAIERRQGNGAWEQVTTVPAAGMTGKTYAYTDETHLTGALTYRLVMTDASARTFNSRELSLPSDTNYITPVRLSSFTVAQQKEKQVINWSTSKEWNLDSFYVERKAPTAVNGRSREAGWDIIAVVPAKGVASEYSYTDIETQEKPATYRVTAHDKDGRDFTSQQLVLTPDLGYRNAFNLKSFTLKKGQNTARLPEWSTSSENGAASFDIERSTDSATWKSVKVIAATGNSEVVVNYSFTDEYNTGTVWVYYRLVMIDKAGARTLSNALKMVALITALPDGPQQPTGKVFAFPNPVSGSFKVNGFANGVDVEVYNSRGVQVYYNKAYRGEEINASAWPAGAYYIVLGKGRYRISLIKL